MTTPNQEQIEILNELIETTLDSADGYREAAKDARNERFKQMFESRALERKTLVNELQSAVRQLGGEPEDDGSMLAATHRMFLNLKSIVTGSDESVINEVENGEDHIKSKYEDALRAPGLDASVKAVVYRAYDVIKADHDQISHLKHELQGRPTP